MVKRALILIDFVNDFFLPKGALYLGPQVRKIVPFAVSVLDEFRKNKETVVFISDAHQAGDRELSIYPKHAMRDSKGSEIIEELTPLSGEYRITKRCYNGVFSTPMADVLKRNYVSEVHLLGVCTSICIMETAAGLFYHGFKLVAYRRGLADLKAADHQTALKRMQKLFQLKIV
jgi:nicotinamidase-related amidase